MSQPIISVEHLSKMYRIAHQGQRAQYATLRDVIAGRMNRLASSFKSRNGNHADATRATKEDFWALKDVSFDVQQGEVLGIIGRNGAGKSTLLKILSRITEPTEGRVTIRGRIASLLEVGTGFHPELTGRENVFLNGAILGMSRAEIKRKFDEIVDFAGVEKFLDTPVKRYSSGMYVRLAFAVAAHLEPEILIVDEVLAVGDAEFQKKCLGKMREVSQRQGRTVLFVSHNIQAVIALTTRALFLDKGALMTAGTTGDVVTAYLAHGSSKSPIYLDMTTPTDKPRINRIELITSEPGNTHVHGEPLEFFVDLYCPAPTKEGGNVSIQLFNSAGVPVVHFWTFNSGLDLLNNAGEMRFKCTVPRCRLFLGKYTVTAYLGDASGKNLIQQVDNVCPFEVTMFKSVRDLEWQEGSSTYVDDFTWDLVGTQHDESFLQIATTANP
jgi:ABC-type polysaccharide/polyol phosphate transport system ATPase subunit